jgi:hypothetical protein
MELTTDQLAAAAQRLREDVLAICRLVPQLDPDPTPAELAAAGAPCHLCGALTPWQLPPVGNTCDTCSPLVLGALRRAGAVL